MFLCLSAIPSPAVSGEGSAAAGAPVALALSAIPAKLPADNNTYPAIVVAVVDAQGNPTVALANISVSLTSSEQNVGNVSAMVVIPFGATYAIANFTTTHTAGSTILTATTTGLATATATVATVVAVGYPTHLVVTAVPSSVPASAASSGNLILELEDDLGLPAKSITNLNISLYSSNTNVANVTSGSTTIQQGQYLKEIAYTSGFVPGAAVITASAPGFPSGGTTVNVIGSPPLALKLIAQPGLMVSCVQQNVSSCQGRLVVALTDLSGNPTLATRDIPVQIRSSNLGIATANATTTIREGNISAITSFTVTNEIGPVTFTASSPGLASSFASITVQNPSYVTPSECSLCQLTISAGPNPVLADHRSYSSVVVSLQNSGNPAVNDTGPTLVTLTSSVTGVGNFTSIQFSIPKGSNWAPVVFTSTYQIGLTTLTASSQNMLSSQTTFGTYGPVPSQVTVSAISSPLPADGQTHPALELSLQDAFGSPAVASFDVPVDLSSSQPGIISVSNAVIPSGQTFVIVNATSGILNGRANVTALVSSFTSGYASSTTQVSTAVPAPSALGVTAPNSGEIMFGAGASQQQPLVAVQLLDSSGDPARARTPVNVTITSSNSTVISSVISQVIGVGDDFASFPLTANVPGKTTLTISTAGMSTTTLAVKFIPYPQSETITGGPANIYTNQSAVVSVNVQLDGSPVVGTPILWKVSSGGLVVVPPKTVNATVSSTSSSATSTSATAAAIKAGATVNTVTDIQGASTAIFHPSGTGTVVITAVVGAGGALSKTLNFNVTVSTAAPSHAGHAKASLTQELTSFPFLLIPVGGAGGAGAAVFLIRRRKSGAGGADEEFDTSLE